MRIRAIATPDKRSSRETRHGEPLTFGVPLPLGFAGDVQRWRFITGGTGDRPGSPVQTRVMDRWADGSPRWVLVDVVFKKKVTLIPLAALREHTELVDMRVLAKGNRLSITPVTEAEWRFITKRLV